MLTVKQITLSGTEHLWEANEVFHDPEQDNGHTGKPGSLTIYTTDGRALQLEGGTIFVMNSHGHVVSRYDLGASMVDHADHAHTTAKAIRDRERNRGVDASPAGIRVPTGPVENGAMRHQPLYNYELGPRG